MLLFDSVVIQSRLMLPSSSLFLYFCPHHPFMSLSLSQLPYHFLHLLSLLPFTLQRCLDRDDPPPLRPLQVYQCRQHPPLPSPASDENTPYSHSKPITPYPQPSPELDLPVALRKGIRSTRNTSHHVTLSYCCLASSHYSCIFSLSPMSIPKTVDAALSHPSWT